MEFRRIAVALREAAIWVPVLKGTFDRFGIPARFYFSSPLRKHPVAIFVGGLISGALDGWDFEAAIETLRAHPRWGRSADFDRFDFKVREAMPGRGASELLALCEPDTPVGQAWLREQIAACLKTEAWKTSLLKPAEWAKRFEALATNLYRPGTLEIPIDHSGLESDRSHVAAVRSWVEAVSSITAFWAPDEPISLEEFWRVASLAVDTAVFHPIDDRANAVHVMNVYEARQWDVSSLFVCGLTDRDFPRQHSQNLLFPDSDIDRLRASGVLLRQAADYEREERWLFETLRTRAADSLFLSYPEHDASGKSVQRSRLLDFDRQAVAARWSSRPVAHGLLRRRTGFEPGWPCRLIRAASRDGSPAPIHQHDWAGRSGPVPVQILRQANAGVERGAGASGQTSATPRHRLHSARRPRTMAGRQGPRFCRVVRSCI